MRRIDKKLNMMKANLLAESNYLKSKELIEESFHKPDGTPIGVDHMHRPVNEVINLMSEEDVKNLIQKFIKEELKKPYRGFLSSDLVLDKKISPRQLNDRIDFVIKTFVDEINYSKRDVNYDNDDYKSQWSDIENQGVVNEFFGFGGFKKESVYPYIGELKKLLLPRRPLTTEMAEKAPNSINEFNKIFDAIIADKGITKQMKKKGINLKNTLSTDEYGMNRASDNYSSSTNNLFLGNVGGLNTKTLEYWVRNIDDAEVANTIGNQLSGWVNSNINQVIEALTSLTKD